MSQPGVDDARHATMHRAGTLMLERHTAALRAGLPANLARAARDDDPDLRAAYNGDAAALARYEARQGQQPAGRPDSVAAYGAAGRQDPLFPTLRHYSELTPAEQARTPLRRLAPGERTVPGRTYLEKHAAPAAGGGTFEVMV